MTVRELELAVKKMLQEAQSPSPENALSPVDLRINLAEFLDSLDEEFSRSPAQREKAQWTLWMMDVDEDGPATFAVAVLRKDGVQLAAGNWDAGELKAFMDGYAGDPEKVIETLAEQVPVAPTRIEVPMLTLHAWVSHE